MKWSSVDWLRDELRVEATASKVPKPREGEEPRQYPLRDGEEWITDRLIRKGPKTERGRRSISIKGTLQRNILRAIWQERAPLSIRDLPDRSLNDADLLDAELDVAEIGPPAMSSAATAEKLIDDLLAEAPATKRSPLEVTEFLESPVWTGPRGKAVGGNAVRSAHREIIGEMGGDPRMVVHDLRHSAASRLGGVSGANLVETAAILGHSGLMEVLTYGHIVDTRRAEIAEKDGALLGVDLDREFGLSLEKWGDEAFHHHGPGEVVKQDGAAYTRRKRSQ